MPPETESQTERGRGALSGTPVRAEGVCSPSVGRGKAWTSRFRHCVVPKSSHILSASSSEFEAYRVEFPAEEKKRWGGFKNAGKTYLMTNRE